MTLRRMLPALGLALLFTPPASATNGMRMPGFGPVQGSMGGVGVGATLDACSLASNPAGLTGLEARVDVAGSWFMPSVDYVATEPQGLGHMVVGQPGVKLDSRRGGSPIPTLAGVIPLGHGLTAGVGAFAVSGMGVDYAQNLYGGETTTSYMQLRVVPALAWKANDLVSVGLGLNLMGAQMSWNVASGFGQQPHDTATSLGLGATLGVKVTPSPMLSFGLAYETKSFFQDFSFEIPAHQGVNPVTFQPVSIPAGTDKLTFHQPMNVSFGVAVTPNDLLVFAADVQWINWVDTNGNHLPAFSSDPNATGAMPWDMAWKNQWVFKLGAQVTPMPGLKLRAGYNYGQMPLQPGRAFENLAFPAVSEHHLTLGGGYDLGKATINAGVTWSPRAEISGSNPGFPAQGGQAIASYTTGMSQLAVDLGFSWRL